MRKLVTVLLVFVACNAVAEPRWVQELKRDLVQRQGDKFVIDQVSVCSVTDRRGKAQPGIQVRSYAEAPASVVSRDNVVAFLTTLDTMLVMEVTKAGGELNCRTVENPIGEVDLETRLTMTAEGFQYEIDNLRDDKKERTTMSWAEVYPPE